MAYIPNLTIEQAHQLFDYFIMPDQEGRDYSAIHPRQSEPERSALLQPWHEQTNRTYESLSNLFQLWSPETQNLFRTWVAINFGYRYNILFFPVIFRVAQLITERKLRINYSYQLVGDFNFGS